MRQRLFAGLVVLGMLAAATPARADFNIQTGLKWVPLRYTKPISVGGGGMGGGLPTAGALYGWQTTSLDNYIALFFTEQIGIQLSLDFGWASGHVDFNGMNSLDASYTQVGVALGAKFYLNRPARERVSPYLLADFFKYFAGVSTNENVTNDVVGYLAGLASPVGFDLAFGAEYFFTTSFSLGAEVLGLRFAHIDAGLDNGGNPIHTNANYFTLYTGVSLNYRFLATASVHTYEEDEDRENPRPKAKKKKKVVQPDGEEGEGGGPPSPESVD
jgi:Outer membrane protein beta-barrel domain